MTIEDRIKGCIFGQAIGDALGLGTEFMSMEEVMRNYPQGLTDYAQIVQDRHRSGWKRGEWTDDTDMMLCIADAVIVDGGTVDYMHIARNFKAWAMGTPRGIGKNTFMVLSLADYLDDPIRAAAFMWRLSKHQSAANGGLMIIYDKGHMMSMDEICQIGDIYSAEIRRYLESDSMLSDYHLDSPKDMGYTLKALAVAMWAYFHAKSFEEGLVAIVNAGGDTDTNAAIACSILGAKFGFSSIPAKCVDGLVGKERLEVLCQDFAFLLTRFGGDMIRV